MTANETVPQGTPTRDLALLHAVIAYARANGWEHDTTQLDDSPLEHRWRRGEDEVSAWNTYLYVNGSRIRPASVRQAVDVLVAFGVLPVEFSSACAEARQEPPSQPTWLFLEDGETYIDTSHPAIVALLGVLSVDGEADYKWDVISRWQEALTTEEPDRTLTAPERRAESDYAPFGVVEETRIAQVQEHIEAGRAVVWTAGGADEEPWKDPNYEVTDAQWQVQIEREAEATEAGLS